MSLAMADWVLLAGALLLVLFVYVFLRHLFSLFLLLLALWAAWRFREMAEAWLLPYIENPTLRQLLAFSAIVLVIVLIGALAGSLIERMLQKLGIAPLVHASRILVSVAFSFLIISGGLGIAEGLPLAPPLAERDWWQGSRLVPRMSWAGAYFQRGFQLPAGKPPGPASEAGERR